MWGRAASRGALRRAWRASCPCRGNAESGVCVNEQDRKVIAMIVPQKLTRVFAVAMAPGPAHPVSVSFEK